jgi:inhibitor of cysteine peptidase
VKKLLILDTAAFLAAVLIICLLAGCVEVKTYTDSGQTIDIGAGQQFVIALGSNPTTGYSWQESYDETMLELVGGEPTYEAEETDEDIVGAGGVEYFRFKALKEGETEITLTYKQPWAGGGIGETKVFTVNID